MRQPKPILVIPPGIMTDDIRKKAERDYLIIETMDWAMVKTIVPERPIITGNEMAFAAVEALAAWANPKDVAISSAQHRFVANLAAAMKAAKDRGEGP